MFGDSSFYLQYTWNGDQLRCWIDLHLWEFPRGYYLFMLRSGRCIKLNMLSCFSKMCLSFLSFVISLYVWNLSSVFNMWPLLFLRNAYKLLPIFLKRCAVSRMCWACLEFRLLVYTFSESCSEYSSRLPNLFRWAMSAIYLIGTDFRCISVIYYFCFGCFYCACGYKWFVYIFIFE
jgi:hypothetical protein